MAVSARSITVFGCVAVVLLLSACQSVGFYAQSVTGHTKLMLARTPVDKALRTAPPSISHKLALSKELKAFATNALALPDNKSYSTYVELDREYPVWVVVAARPLSLNAKQWCYPVIGCASYRGYFSERSAQKYADKLSAKDWETYVGGASAYSTLGWFSDPLLPSMMSGSDAGFAEVLFHELAHQVLYVKGNSDFNEAFATVVGEQGAVRWLTAHQPDALPRYQKGLAARRDFAELIERLKGQLSELYKLDENSVDRSSRIQTKNELIEQFRHRYAVLKGERWHDVGYYDAWMELPINNARLAAFSTYHTLLPDFESLFDACNQDFERFYQRLKLNQDLADTTNCESID